MVKSEGRTATDGHVSAGAPDDIAQDLLESFRRSYPNSEVSIEIFGATVTISRGRRAVQIFVMSQHSFQVSCKRRETFHMMNRPLVRAEVAGVVREMIGDRLDEGPQR